MFEQIFTDFSTIERYQAAPVAEHRLRYLQYFGESGAKRRTLQKIASDQLHLTRLLNLREGDKVSIPRVKSAAREWARPGCHGYLLNRSTQARPTSTKRFFRRAVQWLRFLGWLEEPALAQHPHAAKVALYRAWLERDRGFSEATTRDRCRTANEFLRWLARSDIALGSVRIVDIDRAIAAKGARGHCNRGTIKNYATNLRTFIRFAEDQGWCTPGMAVAIMPSRIHPNRPVPAQLTRRDVERLLATTASERSADTRDRAILMLLVAYGLRSGEVRSLHLDDLDWENETLRVRRSKSGRTDLYPLSRSVGQAILRYILEVRPSGRERSLFFTLTAPVRPLSEGAMGSIVRNRLCRIGIVTGHRGPHAIRHAAAQRLLDQGTSMKVIGDYLGHRHLSSTTAVYAKVNLAALREVADFDLEGLA